MRTRLIRVIQVTVLQAQELLQAQNGKQGEGEGEEKKEKTWLP